MKLTQRPSGDLPVSLPSPKPAATFPEKSIQNFRLRHLLLAIFVAVIYFGVAKLGLSLAFVHANVSPIWPPTGVAIAAVLLLGYRIWPGILLGAFLANLVTPVPLAVAIGIAIGNTLEALGAGLMLRSLDFHTSFDRAKDVLKFVVAALLCTMVSATIGNLSLALGHVARWQEFGDLWLTWWLGDAIGALLIAPLLLTWGDGSSRHWLPGKRYLEAILLLLLLAVSAMATFGGPFPISLKYYPVARLSVPFFLWAAFRLGQRGVTLATVTISVFAVWGTAHGLGPFVGRTPNESLLLLQVFLGSNAVMFLFLVAVIQERRHSEETLRDGERRLAANLAVTRILAESPAVTVATSRILQTIGEKLGWQVGDMWTADADAGVLRCVTVWRAPTAKVDQFEQASNQLSFAPGVGLPGRVWTTLKPAWISDVTKDSNFPRAQVAAAEGLHAAFAFPILSGGKLLGVMEFFSHRIREPDADLLRMFNSIGSQIGQFIERRRTEESLIKTQAALRLAHKVARGGAWQWDLVTNEVEWSNEYCELLGLNHTEVAASVEEWSRRVHPDDLAAVLKEHDLAIANRQDVDIELRMRRDGEWRWFNRTGRCIYDREGKPITMIGITFDITERKRAEEALRVSQAQLANMIGSAMDAIITVDANQRIIIFNAAAEKMFMCSADNAMGQAIDQFIPERFRAAHGHHIRAFEETGVTERSMGALGALFGLRADGHEFPIEASISQIEVKGERLFTVILRDITERKRAEKEREQLLSREHAARAEAELANRTKDEFLAMVSHELRTPLNAMMGWVRMLRDGNLDKEKVDHAIAIIDRNVNTQARLVEDILDVSRIVSGKLLLDPSPVELPQVIEAAVESLRPTADLKKLRLKMMLDSKLRQVSGDPNRLQQVVWNLLSNAIKFTPSGGQIEIIVKEIGDNSQITISDSGEGIRAEFLPHIFDRFRQADRSTTRKHGGLGLGLAIVRQLVELHLGTVEAYSAGEGQGAMFTVTLPVVMTEHTKASDEGHQLDDGQRKNSPVQLTGLRILYVEDDIDSREALAAVLLLYGAEIRSVATVHEALELLTEWKPDLLVSDIGLPGEDGYDLIRKVRARRPEDAGTIPAIALTGYAGASEYELAVSAGYQAYLVKPIEPGDLAQMIMTLIGNGEKRLFYD
jgi:PAS domain S-box-containing protein